ncbi:MAG: winged helix-turn-helix domain-containing protein [Nostoc sp. S4]|nr:winged helix-turn-helix domain-containing protein [Nostoc sp. S4]
MARVSRVEPHLTLEQIKQKIATCDHPRRQQKWLIVYNALVEPRPASAIALHTGTTVRTVHEVISNYNRLAAAAIETSGKGGRHNSYLSKEEETAFLEQFVDAAQTGKITTITQIHQAFEKQVGREVDSSTIYRLLERHGWRKLTPRPYHPKGDRLQQEAFKKTFLIWLNKPSLAENRTILVRYSC